MKKILSLIKIIRPLNLLLSSMTIFCVALLCNKLHSTALNYVFLVVVCFLSASNLLNDVLDISIDKINKPNRILPSKLLNKKIALFFTFLFYTIGIWASLFLNPLSTYMALFIIFPL